MAEARLVIDQWTVLRRGLRTREEHVEQVEQTRARRGLENEPCPVLDLFRAAPFETIHDVVRVEAFCAAHPFWGALYLRDVITTAPWYNDPWAAAMIQLHAVAQLLELHPEDVVAQLLSALLHHPGWTLHSAEAGRAIVGWFRVRHPNPKAFFAQDPVRRHIPADVDFTHVHDRDFLEIDLIAARHAPRQVKGVNGSAKTTWLVGRQDLALDYDALRAVAMRGLGGTVRWLKEQSEAGDQTRFADLDANAVREAVAHKVAQLVHQAPLPAARTAELVAAAAHPDPSTSLHQVMAAAHAAHLAGLDPEAHWGILASIVSGCIRDYDPAGDHAHAAAIDAEIRQLNGL